MVRGGFSQPDRELRGASGAGLGRSADQRQHLLQALSRRSASAPDRAGHRGNHHRQPVHHHRGLLDDPPGDPAGLAAAAADQADLVGGLWPDLCRRRQFAADDRDHRADHRVRQIRQSGRRLRHRRLIDHADDVGAAVHRDARDLGLEPVGGRSGRAVFPDRRRRILPGQPHQDRRGRLRPVNSRGLGIRRDVDLAPRRRGGVSAHSRSLDSGA